MRALCLVLAALFGLIACSTTTSGGSNPTSGPGTLSSSAAVSSSGAPSSGASAPSSSAGTSADGCGADAITARGAPFCYPLPGGFVDSSSLKNYGGGWQYKTLISAGKYDLVEVLGGRLPFDSSSYTDAQLRAYADPRRFHPGDPGLVRVTPLTPTSVAGSRAYQQTAGNDVGAKLQAIFVFHGRSEVYIQCERRDNAIVAEAGCKEVLASIQILTLK